MRIVKGENDLSLVVSGAVGSRDDALVAVDDFNSVMFQVRFERVNSGK